MDLGFFSDLRSARLKGLRLGSVYLTGFVRFGKNDFSCFFSSGFKKNLQRCPLASRLGKTSAATKIRGRHTITGPSSRILGRV